ncbi:unnamed protein product [Ilex paraguariensis]|uniref:Kinesin motor domain-containing protein n=1 Tax=Ilex paraguariensis TaxID=185542 RepID=A0ABC8QUD1_9AQUA
MQGYNKTAQLTQQPSITDCPTAVQQRTQQSQIIRAQSHKATISSWLPSSKLGGTVELVEAILQGRNGSVFCYGATGAGKTYTMLGTVESPGIYGLPVVGETPVIRRSNVVDSLDMASVLRQSSSEVKKMAEQGK